MLTGLGIQRNGYLRKTEGGCVEHVWEVSAGDRGRAEGG